MTTTRNLASRLLLATAALAFSAGAMAQQPARLAQPEVAFLEQAAHNSRAEVEGGKLALAKTANTQIKSFAQQMVDDHGKLGEELAALAAAKGVTLPDAPSLVQKGRLKLLATAAGERFDQRYAKGMGVGANEDALRLFQKAADKANDADVKAFATKALPILKTHVGMARDLKAQADRNARSKTTAAAR